MARRFAKVSEEEIEEAFLFIHLAPVVQTMDSAVHRINYYPADEHSQNQLSYPVDSDLSRG